MLRRISALALATALGAAGCGSGETGSAVSELAASPEAADPERAPGEEVAVDEATSAAPGAGADEDEDAVAAPDRAPHDVVVVVVHDDPLLRSESRLVEVIAERMRMRRIDAIQREATDEEAGFARACFAGEGTGALPTSLGGAATVVFLRFPPNRELNNGTRATRGFGGAIAFRQGDADPYLELRIDDEAAWRGVDEQLWPWLITLVRAEVAS